MSLAADHRYAPIALWRVASRLLITLFNLFGEPQQLAFQHTVVRRDYDLICNWLRTVEALFRKLLFIEASYYAVNLAPGRQRAKRKRVRRVMTFVPERPEEWRVTFRMERARPRPRTSVRVIAGDDARAPYLAPTTFHSAWPLAERFEALLRVHNDPAPYAKRLARRLRAERIDAMLKEPPELRHRIDAEPYAEIEVLSKERRAATAHRSLPDSS